MNGTAEATTLPDRCVDLITVAQAFHWVDAARAEHPEFARILRPAGIVGVFWNWRRYTGSPFLEAYENLVVRFAGDEYIGMKQRWTRDSAAVRQFLGRGHAIRGFEHVHALDLGGLTALLLSASYTPPAGHPDREPMLAELARLFAMHERGGRVEIVYDTELHYGPITDV